MPKHELSLLPETTVRTAKPKDKPYLLRDGGGLWLVVEPSGRKWGKMRVVFAEKENSFSLGDYPAISLAAARAKRENIRKQMAVHGRFLSFFWVYPPSQVIYRNDSYM